MKNQRSLKKEELSPPQYNVLRIVRGEPAGLSRGEIGNRLIAVDPDIARLLDRPRPVRESRRRRLTC